MDRAFWSLWGWPLAIGLASAAGLVAGLLGDGAWDWFAWLGLGVPCVVGAWCAFRKPPPRH